QVVQPVFGVVRRELLNEGQSSRIRDVRRDLAPKGAVTHGCKATLQGGEDLLLCKIAELLSEALEISEDLVIDDADESEQFEQRILQRRGGEKQLWRVRQGLFQRVGDNVRGLVYVPEPVCFVHHHNVPGRVVDISRFVSGELVGANDDLPVRLERPELASLD